MMMLVADRAPRSTVALVTTAVEKASTSHPSGLATTRATSTRMSRQRERDTGIEVALRRELHRMGLRFRVHLQPIKGVRREADIVFTRAQVAVFVDGCFWHGCPVHGTWPKSNEEFWRNKIEGNRRRDVDTDTRMTAHGWAVVRVWEHQTPQAAAEHIASMVRDRRGNNRP